MNLSKFKKVSSDGHVSVLRHKDGHEIKIAHAKLSDSLRSKLDKLPTVHRLADGGNVKDDEDQKLPTPMPAPTPSSQAEYEQKLREEAPISAEEKGSLFAQQFEEQKGKPSSELASLEPSQPTSLEEAKPIQPETKETALPQQPAALKALEKEKAGEMGALQAQAKGAEETAQLLSGLAKEEDLTAAKKAAEAQQARYSQLAAQRQALKDDIMAQHINPQRFIENMSTGKKIMTGLGLILGGMGAGLTHGPNLASEFLDKQIDEDINNQKSELGKRNTLLSENLKETNDLREAMNLTRIQMNDIVSHQLQVSQAKTQNLQAKALMQQVAGKFEMQSAQLQNQIAMQRGAMAGQEASPARLVPFLVPKEHQEQVFKEIEAAENTRKMAGNIMKSFEEAAHENTILRTGAGFIRTPGSVYALHQHMQPTFKDLEGTVRQAAMDNTFKNVTPMPGDTEHKIQQKREALEEYLQSKLSAPRAKAYGIDLSQFASTQALKTNAHEGQTGTLPDGTRVKMVQGKLQVMK